MSREKLPDILKIPQAHSTNVMKGVMGNMKEERMKDKNYKGEKQKDHYLFEYRNPNNELKNYGAKLAIPEYFKKRVDDILFIKFFTFVHYQYNKHGNIEFEFNSREFIEFIGKSPTPKVVEFTNKKLMEYCDFVLPSIKLKWWRGTSATKTMTPFAGVDMKRGIVGISLESEYARDVKSSYYSVPREIGWLTKNAYLMADYIYTYAREAKKHEFSLTIGTLYKKTGLPSYTEISRGNRNTSQLAKDPFYKALQEIKETIGVLDEYLDSSGNVKGGILPWNKVGYKLIIKEDEIESDRWNDFLSAKVHFKIVGFKPDCDKILKMEKKKNKDK